MQRLPARGAGPQAQPLQHMKSFTRYEPANKAESPARSRTSSLNETQNPVNSTTARHTSYAGDAVDSTNDIFERRQEEEDADRNEDTDSESFPEGFDELPVEIQSLMERFLESLTAKVHSTPLTIDRISELYQDFYEHTQSHINTHIATLSTRISREQSPNPSISSFGSGSNKAGRRRPLRALSDKVTAADSTNAADQQMLTASEIAGKRKAKKQLEVKRVAIEEAVERGICDKVYPRLWRHRSTDDEEKDEKLRSRAAALSVVGIGLRELLSSALTGDDSSSTPLDPGNGPAQPHLAEARKSIKAMNDDRYPLGKLNYLTTAHKHIVDALQELFPSTSSADEVLPTLIYTIITSDPETLHVISNLHFIQRFRAASKVNGEAAYCLTNLEAAVSFLQNVDLSSLRRSEALSGPPRSSSRSSTPSNEKSDPLYRGLSKDTTNLDTPVETAKPSGQSHARRLSSLINRPKQFDTASDAVINTAQPAIDSIQNALDGSFKFLFGRLREKQATISAPGSPEVPTPKTLEDARRLVSPNKVSEEDNLDGAENASVNDPLNAGTPTGQDASSSNKLLDLVSGRRGSNASRDRSLSNVSGKEPEPLKPSQTTLSAPTMTSSMSSTTNSSTGSGAAGFAAIESMRNLGNSFNPLKNLTSGMGMMRNFGTKSAAASPPPTASPAASTDQISVAKQTPLQQQQQPPTGIDITSIAPPLQRFVEVKDARELNFFDVDLLLRDYQRLAGALHAAGGNAPV